MHMAIAWQPHAGRRSPGTLLRPSPAGLSFSLRPGTSITHGLQEQTRDQAELPRPLAAPWRDERDEWLWTKLRWRPGQAVSYSRRPNTSTAHDTVPVTLRPLAPHHPNILHTLRLCDGTPLSCNAQRLHRAIPANAATANEPVSVSLLRPLSRLAHQPFPIASASVVSAPQPASGSRPFRLGRRAIVQSSHIVIIR